MEKTKKLTRKHFRYLTKKEIKNPLYTVAKICRFEMNLYEYCGIINKLMTASSTCVPRKIKTRKINEMSFYCEQLMRNIELLYLLKHRVDDWTLDKYSSFYGIEFGIYGALIDDNTLCGGTTLHFKRLKKNEVKNIGIFLHKFFKFKSLQKWHKLIADLHCTFFSESRLSDYPAYRNERVKVFNYFEKLAEATFLIYEIKAKEYIFRYHAKEFFLEKYLKQEGMETPDDVLKDESHHSEASSDEKKSTETVENLPSDEASDEVI